MIVEKKYIILLLIFIQLLFIGIIVKNIYKKSVLGVVSINPVQSDTLTISQKSDDLQYFYEPKPNIVVKPEPLFDGLENISYHINNDTFNQINNISREKPNGVYRIIMLGDSFTFGANVNTVDNYPSQLQQLLNEKLSCPTIKKFEVINLGVGGYDIQYTIERLKLRGIKYQPDLVIWLLIQDDFMRINERLKPKADNYKLEAKQTADYYKNLQKGNYQPEWKKAKDEVINEIGGEDKVLDLQKKYINQINNFYSGQLVLTTFPMTKSKYKETLEIFSSHRRNTFFYDQLPNIYQITDAFLPDSHPSKMGHSLIAENILGYLIKEKIIPCDLKEKINQE